MGLQVLRLEGRPVLRLRDVLPDQAPRGPPGEARQLRVPAVAQADTHLPLLVSGEPGESVRLFRSRFPTFDHRPDLHGVLHLRGVVVDTGIALGTIHPEGVLETKLPVDLVLGGRSHAFLQARLTGATGEVRLSHPAAVTLYGEGFGTTCRDRIHVDADAPPGGDGRSWATAYRDLGTALWQAQALTSWTCEQPHLEVWVAEGTYTGDEHTAFRLGPGTHLIGGFAGWESSPRDRDVAAHPTILSGDIDGNDQPDGSGTDENSKTVLAGTSGISDEGRFVDGVQVVAARQTGISFGGPADVVRGCWVHDNVGLGVLLRDGALLVDSTVERCERGVRAEGGSKVIASVVRGNEGEGAAGVRLHDDSEMIGCAVHGNRSAASAAGVLVDPGWKQRIRIRGCTIHGNESGLPSVGAGVHVAHSGGALSVADSILWMNVAGGNVDEAAQLYSDSSVPIGVEYTCIQGLSAHAGTGNHGQDPLFVDPFGTDGVAGTADDDLRLGFGSPCVDAGASYLVPPDHGDLDRDGNRLEPTPRDLGGLRRFFDDPDVTDTGAGPPPIVDMGAHERQEGS